MTAIYGLETGVCVLQGNARFWNGLAASYSQSELFLVRANAMAVLSRLDSVVATPGPLHTCLVCNEGVERTENVLCS
jgi:hypothetical protein